MPTRHARGRRAATTMPDRGQAGELPGRRLASGEDRVAAAPRRCSRRAARSVRRSRPRPLSVLQHREVLPAPSPSVELVEVLGADVLQLLLAEVADRHALGEIAADERARRLREQHLPAVARRADPRRADDVHADVALVADRRLAGVQAHPHLDLGAARPLVRRERALAGDRGRDRVARTPERVEERVALRVDLAPAGRAERLAQDPPVVGDDRRRIRSPSSLEQLGRALDVREEERDRSGRVVGHRAIIVAG